MEILAFNYHIDKKLPVKTLTMLPLSFSDLSIILTVSENDY